MDSAKHLTIQYLTIGSNLVWFRWQTEYFMVTAHKKYWIQNHIVVGQGRYFILTQLYSYFDLIAMNLDKILGVVVFCQ